MGGGAGSYFGCQERVSWESGEGVSQERVLWVLAGWFGCQDDDVGVGEGVLGSRRLFWVLGGVLGARMMLLQMLSLPPGIA